MINFTFKFKGEEIQLSWTNVALLRNNLLGQVSNLGDNNSYSKEYHQQLESVVNGIQEEYNNILSRLENIEFPENPIIVDIGCGTGIIDLVLAKYFKGKATFYLIDGDDDLDAIEKNQNELIHSPGFKTANSWKCFRDGLVTNNISSSFRLMSPSDSWEGIQADVVMSIGSCGLHYPIDQYWERIKTAVKPQGYLGFFPLLSLMSPAAKIKEVFGPAILHNSIPFKQVKEKRANDYTKWLRVWPNLPNDDDEWAAFKIWQNNR